MQSSQVLARDEVRAGASTAAHVRKCAKAAVRRGCALQSRAWSDGVQSGVQVSATGAKCDQLEAAVRREIPPEATGSFRRGAGRSQVQILSPRLNVLQIPLNSTSRYRARCIAGCKVTGWRESGRLRGGAVSAILRPPGHLHPSFAPHRPIAPRRRPSRWPCVTSAYCDAKRSVGGTLLTVRSERMWMCRRHARIHSKGAVSTGVLLHAGAVAGPGV